MPLIDGQFVSAAEWHAHRAAQRADVAPAAEPAQEEGDEPSQLTPQQKGAATRAANRQAAEAQAMAAMGISPEATVDTVDTGNAVDGTIIPAGQDEAAAANAVAAAAVNLDDGEESTEQGDEPPATADE